MSISTHIGDETVMAITSAQIQQLYVAYLGRAADKAGLDYWLNDLNGSTTAPATLTLENLRANFVNEQPEYTSAYAGLTRSETVSKIYLQLFGRSADAAGLEYWTNGDGASVNADQLLVAFVNGAGATDAKIVANKVLVAEVYTSSSGANYTADDAKSIIANVDETTGSVTGALTDLAALPGIALPANVALVKADVAAAAAVTSYETSKVASLVALNDKVVALNATSGANITLASVKDGNADKIVDYSEAANAIANTTELRDAISENTTDELSATSITAVERVAEARALLVANDANAVTKINAYNAAVAADAEVAAVDSTAVANSKGSLDGVLSVGSNQETFDASVASYKTASGSNAVITTGAELYAELVGANAAKLAQLDTAFSTGTFASIYSTLKTLAATDAAKLASEAKVDDTASAVGSYADRSVEATTAAKVLADAKAADALVAQGEAEFTAHKAVTDSASDANHAVTVTNVSTIHDIHLGAIAADENGTSAELFYFSAIKATDDVIVVNFAKGDALYVGDGLAFNSNVTVDTDGFAVGTNTAAKEIYFTKDINGVVNVNIETNAVGHTAGTGATDNVAVITLSGITDLSEVSYANGIVTTSHVVALAP
jgi:hypothetical protein